jgi:hypothetical protein
MPELRQCRTCTHDYEATVGGRHDCGRFRGAIKVRDPALLWIREQSFDERGLPRPEADRCPGWQGWNDEPESA